MTRGSGDGLSGLDLWTLRPALRSRSILCMNAADGNLPCPDLRMLRPTRRNRLRTARGHPATTNSGFPRFDPLALWASRGWFRPAASRGCDAALPGGYGLLRLDLWLLPWRRSVGRRPLCRGLRGRLLLHGRVRRGMCFLIRFPLPGGFFLLQQILYPTFGPPHSVGSGVLNLVAAVVAGLPPLGSLPELAPQALRAVIQPTADKLFRRCFDFFF